MLRGDGARRAGEYLRRLVGGPYRQVWLIGAGRVRQGRINNLAVARVIASHLWDTGERSDQDQALALRLRDRVTRALAGEVLSPETLRWFIDAFKMSDDHADQLWALLYGENPWQRVPDDGWYLKSLRTLLLLDGVLPTAIEHRVIVAVQDGLDEIVVSVSLPRATGDARPGHELHTEVLSGGTIATREQPYESHFRQVLTLPAPLRKGEPYEFVLRRTVPAGQPMAPHYVHVPHRRSDHFDLRVRFGGCRVPSTVWRLSGLPTAVIYDQAPTSELVAGEAGEFHASFDAMVQGLAYGLCWTPERASQNSRL